MNKRIQNVFEFFENVLPKYYGSKEIRNSQVQMAIDIAAVLSTRSDDKTIMADTPVGTGKTFAVLIPSIYNQNNNINTSRIIYSTSSLNLQAQLKNEELKILKELFYIKDFIVAKGQTHYICPRRIDSTRLPQDLYKALKQFISVAIEGERTEFERMYHPVDELLWSKINLESQSKCRNCDLSWSCPTFQHRNKFNDLKNQVVVTNHNQLIQSVLNVSLGYSPIINYNRAGIIIIDEAHDFEEACLSQLAKQISFSSIEKCTSNPRIQKSLKAPVNALKAFAYKTRQKLDTSSGRQNLSDNEFASLLDIKKILDKYLASQVARIANRLYKNEEAFEDISEKVYDAINSALDKSSYVSWLNIDENNESLVVVTKKFKREIKNIINLLAASNKVIFTSGTLAVNGSFEHLYYSWGGKPPAVTTTQLDTVFDYSKQALVYLPRNIPVSPNLTSPRYEEYCRTLSDEILKLIKITGGRTLILCTALRQMELIYSFLKPYLERMNIKFLKQGHKSIELLSEEFKNDETSVLIGSGSFFTGLSVKGNSLISVILCKLPFPPKDDPFLKLVAADCDDSERMEMVDFPRMLIKLLQGGGRLIRSIDDFGVFSILDPRTSDRSYSWQIIDELVKQKYQLTHDINTVRDFIETRFSNPGFAEYPKYSRGDIAIPDTLTKEEMNIPTIKLPSAKDKFIAHHVKDGLFTKKQIEFYVKVRSLTGLDNKLLKTIKTPYDMFKHLYKLSTVRGLPVDVISGFPYDNAEQQANFKRRIKSATSSRVKSYFLTPEELSQYQKGWEKPTHKII